VSVWMVHWCCLHFASFLYLVTAKVASGGQ
jgi:hypothetical protein